MKADDFDKEVAARTVYGEARGEDRATQLGVAWALVNRAEAGKWFSGKTLAECCAMHAVGAKYGQFSCWNSFDPNYPQMFRADNNEPALLQCRGAVNVALLGQPDEDPTHGATHYCNLEMCHPSWVDSAIRTVTIGKLTFFKSVS